MSYFRLARVLSISLVVLAFAAAPSPAVAGVYYTAESVTESDQGDPQRSTVKAWVDGDKAKVEFEQNSTGLPAAGTYLLTSDGGKTLHLVNPEEKTYSRFDLGAMLQAAGPTLDAISGMVSMEFSEPQVERLLEEDGGSILGLPTTHLRYRTSYSMKLKVMGIKRDQDIVTEQDLWTTDAFDEPAMRVWLRNEPPPTGDESLDRVIAAEVSKIDGLPLKTIAVSTVTGGKKKRSTTTKMTTEVTSLERREIPAATFELPAGYEERAILTGDEADGNPLKGLFGGGR